jgi:amino acid transporter
MHPQAADPDPSPTNTTPSASSGGALFTRQATGLVRDVSPLSTLVFNVLTAPSIFVLAVGIFYALGAFPGANLYVAFGIAYALGIIFSFTIGLVSSAMPRSGGDYVFVGRVLHPVFGLISSFCFTVGVILSIAFFVLAVITTALGPGLAVIGLIAHSSTVLDWSNTLENSKGWQYGLGIGALVLVALMASAKWRVSVKIQNIGFILAMVSLLVALIAVLVNSGGHFIANFNSFAQPFTGQSDSYHSLIATAHQQGIATHPSTSFGNTVPAIGAVLGFSMFTWYSAHIAGEVRQAKRLRIPMMMVAANVINGVIVVILTAVFINGFGIDFFTAVNALSGTKAYPFAAPPTYIFLAAIGGGSAALGAFLAFAFLVAVMLILWLNFVQPVRAIFAYAFDGILPLKASHVSSRSSIPTVALGVTFVICAGVYAWAVFTSSFFTVYATGIMFTLAAFILMSLSAILLAHRRPELWRSSAVRTRVLGVPLTTIGGIVALGITFFMGYLFIGYSGLGLTSPVRAVIYVVIVIAAAVVTYVVASVVRARQGVSLSKATAEIPPE